ncbi:MAG TPA: hypothetical protein VNG89_28215, partial [Vicinamibacterales bacterium]|nr:hypothetical protein [Vicinamibacterales bacterium]
KTELDHINDSLAKVEAIDSDRGRILIYDLHADDLITARGKFSSRFAVNAQFTRGTSVRVFDEASMSHAYTFWQAVRGMRRVALEAQLGAYASSYFPNTFGAGEASLQTWVSDLDRTLDAVLKNGSDNFGNTLLQLDVSAPAALVGGWALAPAAEKAEAYFEMSKAIQKQLRTLIPLVHFANLDEFRTLPAAAALLVYAALPLATGIVVDSGRIVQFDDKRDVYWDITPANIKAMADHSLTLVHLLDALRRIHETLVHADGFADLASKYDPARPDRIIAAALNDTVGAADLNNLLGVERSVIREAQAAGRRIAGFMQAKNSSEARRQLAAFGANVTEAFNSQIGGLFSSRQLRPLGTLVFLEAARAFDPSLKAAQPSAMLELTVLREQPSFDMRTFVDGVEVPAADIVRAERFVSLS